MKLAITGKPGEYLVWSMLDDPSYNPNPANRGESFVIGAGRTLEEALTAADVTLTAAAGELAVLLHDAVMGRPVEVIP